MPFTRTERETRAALPIGERQAITKNMFIGHDRFTTATAKIANFHMPVKGGTPDFGSLFVMSGDPRTGKSFVLQRYAAQFPVENGDEGVIRRVVVVDMPIDCTGRAFVEAIASALNINFFGKVTADFILGNVLQALKRQKVELLLLDESQEAFNPERKNALRQCPGYLRKILNLRTLNVVSAGLPETYQILVAHPQLKGRGLMPHHLVMPYEWENEKERRTFRLLCDIVDENLPFVEMGGLGKPWFAQRLHYVSNGIIGHLKDFIFMAACRALNEQALSLTASHCSLVWNSIKPVGMSFDPFTDDMGSAPQRASLEKPQPVAPKGAAVSAAFSLAR